MNEPPPPPPLANGDLHRTTKLQMILDDIELLSEAKSTVDDSGISTKLKYRRLTFST